MEPREIRIAFGGGGGEDDERMVLDRFAAWLGGGRVLYVPLASEQPSDASIEWVTTVTVSRGIGEIVVARTAEDVVRAVPAADGVLIGGGDTYRLLSALKGGGADAALVDAAMRGLPIYGGSAGAILLGNDIDTAQWDDTNADSATGTAGLSLALGYSIACHYNGGHAYRLRAFVDDRNEHVAAIPERGGLVRTGNTLTVVGPEPVVVFWPERSTLSVDAGGSLPVR